MNYQWFDIVQSVVIGISVLLLMKGLLHCSVHEKHNKLLHYGPIAVSLVVFFFSPVNMTQKNASMQFTSQPKTLPEQIKVENKTFEETQEEKLNKLKQQSEEKRNEEIDR